MRSSDIRHTVASIAAHKFVFGKVDGLVIFDSKCPGHRHLGQGSSEQICSVTGIAVHPAGFHSTALALDNVAGVTLIAGVFHRRSGSKHRVV